MREGECWIQCLPHPKTSVTDSYTLVWPNVVVNSRSAPRLILIPSTYKWDQVTHNNSEAPQRMGGADELHVPFGK